MCPEYLAEVNEGWVGTEVSNGVGELGPGGYPEPHSPPEPTALLLQPQQSQPWRRDKVKSQKVNGRGGKVNTM